MIRLLLWITLLGTVIPGMAQTKTADTDIPLTKESDGDDRIFVFIEQAPSYLKGTDSLQRFISKNLRYPEKDKQAHLEGIAYVYFVVAKDSTLSNVTCMRSPSPAMGEEAVRLIKESGKWIPGKQNSITAKMSHTLPIKFSLPSDVN